MLQHICNNISKLYLVYKYSRPSLQVIITIIANNNIYYIRCMQLYTSQNNISRIGTIGYGDTVISLLVNHLYTFYFNQYYY